MQAFSPYGGVDFLAFRIDFWGNFPQLLFSH